MIVLAVPEGAERGRGKHRTGWRSAEHEPAECRPAVESDADRSGWVERGGRRWQGVGARVPLVMAGLPEVSSVVRSTGPSPTRVRPEQHFGGSRLGMKSR